MCCNDGIRLPHQENLIQVRDDPEGHKKQSDVGIDLRQLAGHLVAVVDIPLLAAFLLGILKANLRRDAGDPEVEVGLCRCDSANLSIIKLQVVLTGELPQEAASICISLRLLSPLRLEPRKGSDLIGKHQRRTALA